MRKFKIINADGLEFDLMRKDAFFNLPTGLGFSISDESFSTGFGWIETESELEQGVISGEMVILNYSVYSEFSKFCAKEPLVFCYAPAGSWFFRDCKISKLDKGDIDEKTHRLVCPIDLLCYSVWYDNKWVFKATTAENDGKTYNYKYPYVYSETTAGAVTLLNTGAIQSPCRIHVQGVVVNPKWALTVNGVVTQRGEINITIPNGNKLLVDSTAQSMEIAEYTHNNEFVRNLYQYSDFSTSRFIFAPPGTSVLSFSHEGINEIQVYVEVKEYAAAV